MLFEDGFELRDGALDERRLSLAVRDDNRLELGALRVGGGGGVGERRFGRDVRRFGRRERCGVRLERERRRRESLEGRRLLRGDGGDVRLDVGQRRGEFRGEIGDDVALRRHLFGGGGHGGDDATRLRLDRRLVFARETVRLFSGARE